MVLHTQRSTFLIALLFIVFASCKSDDDTIDDNTDDNPPVGLLGEIDYVKTFGGSNNDEAVAMVEATDGGYVIVGSTSSTGGDIVDKTEDDKDFWVIKTATDGTIMWSKTYGGSNDDEAKSINTTLDGGYILGGYTRSDDGDVNSGNAGFNDYWILKLSSTGDIEWEKTQGFSGDDQAFEVFQTSDGGYLASGFLDVTASGGAGNDNGTRNSLHGVGEYWIIKMDADGNNIWRRYYGGSDNDRSYDALETPDGGFLITGASESADFDITDDKGTYDFWAVRLDANGDKIWTRSFGGSEIDIAFAITLTPDNNYLLVGDTRSDDKDITNLIGNADVWVVKFDDNGSIIWEQTYGGTQFESARDVVTLDNGNFAIVGSTRSADGNVNENFGVNDAWLFVINGEGDLQFELSVGGSLLDFADGIIQTTTGELVMVGNTESTDNSIGFNRGGKDLFIAKIK